MPYAPDPEAFDPELFDPVVFAGRLRAAGLVVPVSAVLMWVEALGTLGTSVPDEVYWTGRCTLVRRPEDTSVFDAAFAEFFLGVEPPREPGDPGSDRAAATPERPELSAAQRSPGGDPPASPSGDPRPGEPSPGEPAPHDADPDGPAAREFDRWSRAEVLRRADLAACTPEELEELWAVLSRIRLDAPERRSRRRRAAGRGELDLRRTVRTSLRRGGEPLRPLRRAPSRRRRRLVLLVDVSGSMEPYARGLLRFAHAVVQSRREVEVFAFATRLTRLTRDLGSSEPDAALERAAARATDLAGGTRLGEVLAEFNRRWGLRGTARGADIVVLSDGWDRGDPTLVGAEMERLARVAHRVVWVNPLKASEGYRPLAAGMAAALPHVDEFVEGHSVASLDDLATLLAASTAR